MYRVRNRRLSGLKRITMTGAVVAASVGLIGCSNPEPSATHTTTTTSTTAAATSTTTTSTVPKVPEGPQPQSHAELTSNTQAGVAVANDFGANIPISKRPQGVSCEYRVPQPDANDNRSVSGEWAGIGGVGGTTLFPSNGQLIQIGTDSVGSAFRSRGIHAWYETVNPEDPSASKAITIPHFKVMAGDSVIASVRRIGSARWQLTIEDLSERQKGNEDAETFTKRLRFDYFGQSAECVVENPQSSSLTHLGDFGTLDFTNLHFIYEGKTIPFSASALVATLSMQDTATSQLQNNAFSVRYTGPVITEKSTKLKTFEIGQAVYSTPYAFTLEDITENANGKPSAQFEISYNGRNLSLTPPIPAGDSTAATLSDNSTIYLAVKSINAQKQSAAAVFTIEMRS